MPSGRVITSLFASTRASSSVLRSSSRDCTQEITACTRGVNDAVQRNLDCVGRLLATGRQFDSRPVLVGVVSHIQKLAGPVGGSGFPVTCWVNTKADARVTIGAINLRFIVFPFLCNSECSVVLRWICAGTQLRRDFPQELLCIPARDHFALPPPVGFGVFQRRIANHPPSTMSIVPQKPGHQTGMPGFVTSA